MKFIELTQPDNEKIYLNIDAIRCFTAASSQFVDLGLKTAIFLKKEDDSCVHVEETCAQILNKIEMANMKPAPTHWKPQ